MFYYKLVGIIFAIFMCSFAVLLNACGEFDNATIYMVFSNVVTFYLIIIASISNFQLGWNILFAIIFLFQIGLDYISMLGT